MMTAADLREAQHEEWFEVPGWPAYEISVKGTIRNAKTKRVRRPFTDAEGYAKVTLCNGRPCKPPVRVHRLVALAFLGDAPPGKEQVNHINGDRADNAAWNLEWCGPKENISHSMHALGRRRKLAERRRADGKFGKVKS